MTAPRRFALRPQGEVERALYLALAELEQADPTDEERVSWWGGRVVGLLLALGAEEGEAIDAMYTAWRDRDREY